MNPSYIEEFNGSDYVCMSGGSSGNGGGNVSSSNKSIQKPITSGIATSNIVVSGPTSISTPKHISSVAPAIAVNEPPKHQYDEIACVSPTPSQLSSESGSGKRILLTK